MYKIRDWLYISGYPEASNESVVRKEGIKAMLLLFKDLNYSGIEHLFLPVLDGQPMSPEMITKGVAFVKRHQERGQKVLVACGAGISRSVTMSTAALKEIEGLSLRDAFMDIRKINREALPDHVHWQSLLEYYGGGIDYWTLFEELIDLK
jgi:protein-tyrosine phosphatase